MRRFELSSDRRQTMTRHRLNRYRSCGRASSFVREKHSDQYTKAMRRRERPTSEIDGNVFRPNPSETGRCRRTDFISEPLFLNIVRVPNFPWEVCCTFINVGKLDEFRIEVWIAERAIGHERVVEMLWLLRISLQGVELCELRLRNARVRNTDKN